jgi:hypothetical protein
VGIEPGQAIGRESCQGRAQHRFVGPQYGELLEHGFGFEQGFLS